MRDSAGASALVLGPVMRYVDESSASIWVETQASSEVVVHAAGRSWGARTFAVHDHHYALVEASGLEPGTVAAYSLEIDGEHVWPPAGSPYPPSVIATRKPGKPLRMAFGSCRTSVAHDEAGNSTHGVDAMRAYALRMAAGGDKPVRWPDLILFLGDQVYADETTEAMREFICSRRDIEQPPGPELQDYEEYSHLYELAWTDPANRWLLSTLPSAMIFDDHDIRDDWNTSLNWRRQMESTSWWQGRIVAGLASYWVYQHLGNLSPADRAADEIWQQVCAVETDDEELDLTETLDALAARVNEHPDCYRWSYARDFGDARLIVVDSRAARVLTEGDRSILDPSEMAWLDEQMQGGVRHLLIGTSLPYLLAPGLHHLEAWDEALEAGVWGERAAHFGEKLRQAVDLEHWAAFQEGFLRVARMTLEVAQGRRGDPPQTIAFLSGDVHHSYLSQVSIPGATGAESRIVQAVCSPIRNPLPRYVRFATAFLSYGVAAVTGSVVSRSVNVPPAPFSWRLACGPWFDNSLATLETYDTGMRIWWETGVVHDGRHHQPLLERVAAVLVSPKGAQRVNQGSRWRRRLSRLREARSRRAR